MKICLLVIGKTDAAYIRAGIEEYEKRMGKYVNYEKTNFIGFNRRRLGFVRMLINKRAGCHRQQQRTFRNVRGL